MRLLRSGSGATSEGRFQLDGLCEPRGGVVDFGAENSAADVVGSCCWGEVASPAKPCWE